MEDFVVLKGITKTFGDFVANKDIHFAVKKQQVHALLGENGAGKSTLMKLLYGVYQPDSGEVLVNGKPVVIHSPHDAREVGIGMVFQSFMLVPAFTVIENVALSLKDLGLTIDRKDIEKRILEISDKYGFDLDPHAKVWQLPIGAQQKIEIIKLVMAGARLLIFDEPTSVLAPHEAQSLFQIFDSLRDSGYTIIFISHKLNEVLRCADEITVLRRGQVVGTIDRAQATEDVLVEMIIGEKSANSKNYARKPVPQRDQPLLEMRDVVACDDRGRTTLNKLNLTIYPGEIVGIAGVSGNGQKEAGEVIQSIRDVESGQILLDGVDISHWSIFQVRQAGVVCIPEDPLAFGAVPTLTVEENLALGDVEDGSNQGWLPVNWQRARSKLDKVQQEFGLQMPRLNVPIRALSGGNVQRIVFARELAAQSKLLLAYYPTRGTDINAAEIIRTVLLHYRNLGGSILLISEDLDELFMIADRMVVMYHGRNVGERDPKTADINEIGYLMTDGKFSAKERSPVTTAMVTAAKHRDESAVHVSY
ncbi:MAG: ABC transporter ATP-binding protein [Anaerolineae bacterium]|nr:ABC transporter ATP-binding protein [Anaerolineae bacterium]